MACNVLTDESKTQLSSLLLPKGCDLAVKSLLRHGAGPNARDSTALDYAPMHGYEDIARILLLNPDIQLDDFSPLDLALRNEH